MAEGILISPAVGFYLVAWGLFVLDSSKLIYVNQVVFSGVPGKAWVATTPLRLPWIAKRFLFIPNPLKPWRVAIAKTWPAITTGGNDAGAIQKRFTDIYEQLRPIRFVGVVIHCELFCALPVLYFFYGGIAAGLLVIAIYLQVFGSLMWLLSMRQALEFSWERYALLAFESLICMPYAVNMHRRVFEHCNYRLGHFRDLWNLLGGDSRQVALGQMQGLLDKGFLAASEQTSDTAEKRFLTSLIK